MWNSKELNTHLIKQRNRRWDKQTSQRQEHNDAEGINDVDDVNAEIIIKADPLPLINIIKSVTLILGWQ